MHYVLNGTTEGGEEPIASAVMEGIEIPDTDGVMGYGPVRYLEPEQVSNIAKALERVNPKQLVAKLNNPEALEKKIYLAHTFDPGEWEYLPALFEGFRGFYRNAAAQGNAMLLITF